MDWEGAEGDLRKAINSLQAAASLGEQITDETVHLVTGRAAPTEIKEMIAFSLKGEFMKARDKLRSLLLEHGLSGSDIIRQTHSQILKMDIPERSKVLLVDALGEIDARLVQGANEEVQLSVLLARIGILAPTMRSD